MRLRTRLFLLVAAIVASTIAAVTLMISASARSAFATLDEQRTAALVGEFRREFAREGEEVARRVERIAESSEFRRTALDMGAPGADNARYVAEAASLAAAHGLDLLDVVADDGTIISSAHWPARFGYRHAWATPSRRVEGTPTHAFLQGVETPDGTVLGLVAVRKVMTGSRDVFIAGGRTLDRRFLESLELPAGMRVFLYRNLDSNISADQLVGASGRVAHGGQLAPLIARVRDSRREARDTIESPEGPETVYAIPLTGGDGGVVGILLVSSSRRDLSALLRRIRWTGFALGALGTAVGFALSYSVAARVTKPVEHLAEGVRAVAAGNWEVELDVRASGEIAQLATAFHAMTRQLADQRDRLVQAERVAAWRELARRLAHELKNPLFPLRITIDNLRRAKADHPRDFDEVFDESMATLSTGLGNLTSVIAKFSDFARMPEPRFEETPPNDIVRQAVQLFHAQLASADHPRISISSDLDPAVGTIRGDPEQLGRAVQNVILNAIDAMPAGGTLTIRTRRAPGAVRLEIADTGEGLADEERRRLFTPYYTTKQHGTGLGLAIVQSVVADHHGKIWVESEPGRGTTFYIELPS